MAAGDIILSDGSSISPEDLVKIAAEVKKLLEAGSKELSQYEEASSLSGVTSLPGIFQQGDVSKLVRVALTLLKGLDGKDGEDGREIQLQVNSTHIQWRYSGTSSWNNLIALSELKGEKGDRGEKGEQGEQGVQGEKGEQGEQGVQGEKGDTGEKGEQGDQGIQGIQGETGKTPVLKNVEVQNGTTPSGSFTKTGDDSSGNPEYKLSLVVQAGKDGQPPVFEIGTVSTGLPSSDALVEVVPNGYTPEGNPKYLINFTIPKGEPGQDGTGSGNVYVVTEGIVGGKTYLFRPNGSNSANGTLVEYTPLVASVSYVVYSN